MKTRFLVLFLSIIFISSFSFVQCCTPKSGLQTKTPFTIAESFYQDWVGGVPGVSGTTIHIITNDLEFNVTPDSLFFRDKRLKIEIKTSDKGNLWIAHYNNKSKTDINMTDSLMGEYGNMAPNKTNLPYNLNKNEAVLSYYYKGLIQYYKIENLEKKETLFLPATRPKN